MGNEVFGVVGSGFEVEVEVERVLLDERKKAEDGFDFERYVFGVEVHVV